MNDPVTQIVAAMLERIADDLEANAARIRESALELRASGLPDPDDDNRRHSLRVVPDEVIPL